MNHEEVYLSRLRRTSGHEEPLAVTARGSGHEGRRKVIILYQINYSHIPIIFLYQ
jgi:alpha-L-arabinofuranosidase